MKTPTISVILPVRENEEHFRNTVASIQAQSFQDFEVICVGDCAEGLQKAWMADTRFRLLRCSVGVGAARNAGFLEARGDYVIFPDGNDWFSPDFLEKLQGATAAAGADIAVCDYSKIQSNGREIQQRGIHTEWLPAGAAVFSYRDAPDYIMRLIDSALGIRLYRSEFIRSNGLRFSGSETACDLAFAAVSGAAAERIIYVNESLVRHREDVPGKEKPEDMAAAVSSGVLQAQALPHSDRIQNAILSFVVGNYIRTLTAVKDFSASDAEKFYTLAHETFNGAAFARVDARTLRNPKQFREFCTVRKHDYKTMKQLVSRKLIVSLTTFPKRIGLLGPVLDSIYAQTRKADQVVLWLAEEQFPGKEDDLPENLRKLAAARKLTVRWCDDLKPHKKYFYALQEYSNDLVVTVDDDLLYSRDMLDALYRSYLLYPEAVSTCRAHLMLVSEQNEIMPYGTWIQETDQCIYEPSMQLMATGGAGVLYPPNLLRREFFNAEAIKKYCLWADDLWLKVMQLMSDVPVVVARPHEPLQYLPDSQEEALHRLNVGKNHNDVQLENVSRWLDETYEPGILVKKLTEFQTGVPILGMKAVSRHLDEERKALRRKWIQADGKIKASELKARQAEAKQHQAEAKQHQAEAKQHQAEVRQKETEDQLRQTIDQLRRTENQLRQTENTLRRREQRIRELEPLASVGGQYQDLGRFLRELKAERGCSIGWCVKYGLYLLAWIPAKLLIATVYLLKNGIGASVKRLLQKLFRRG